MVFFVLLEHFSLRPVPLRILTLFLVYMVTCVSVAHYCLPCPSARSLQPPSHQHAANTFPSPTPTHPLCTVYLTLLLVLSPPCSVPQTVHHSPPSAPSHSLPCLLLLLVRLFPVLLLFIPSTSLWTYRPSARPSPRPSYLPYPLHELVLVFPVVYYLKGTLII